MESMIHCRHLTKQCGKFRLENIDFSLEPGYILGVIGKNGAGKTTLLRCILGSYPLKGEGSRGNIYVAGRDILQEPADCRSQTAYVLQDTPFDRWLTAMEAGKIYGRYYPTFDMKRYTALLREYQVPFEGKEKRSVIKDFSKGEQIRHQLAFAQSYDAKLFVFDEVTGNLDRSFREECYQKIRELIREGTRSVIYATHLVEELEEFADYILWLKREGDTGSTRYFGTVEDLREQYRMVEADAEVLERIDDTAKIGSRDSETHKEALIRTEGYEMPGEVRDASRYADLKEIMYYVEKQADNSKRNGVIV